MIVESIATADVTWVRQSWNAAAATWYWYIIIIIAYFAKSSRFYTFIDKQSIYAPLNVNIHRVYYRPAIRHAQKDDFEAHRTSHAWLLTELLD